MKSPSPSFDSKRPAPSDRKFVSEAVEEAIRQVEAKVGDKELAWLFANCFPNTLDTTVHYSEEGGIPSTYVITGDIDAMWLRDSSAQVWPYLPLAKRDKKLQNLLGGVIRRQAHCIRLDPYANAFYDDPNRVSEWASDFTEMHPGVHERKWEVDSLCYPVRLSHGYWKETGDTSPFDASWEEAMDRIVQTFQEQQRKHGHGPYAFQRGGSKPAPDSPSLFGSPMAPNGMICSRFRPSDDPTDLQFLVPSNFFAVASLRHMSEMLAKVRHQPGKAQKAHELAEEVAASLKAHAIQNHPKYGPIYAYELDGLGHVSLVPDDSNVPSLTSMPYLAACKTSDPVYKATRKYVWSTDNPWYFTGTYSGIGSPHTGDNLVWPLAFITFGLTSTSKTEVHRMLHVLKSTHAGTGFMHESFDRNDPSRFTRPWFAWANTLFGEFVLHALNRYPAAFVAL